MPAGRSLLPTFLVPSLLDLIGCCRPFSSSPAVRSSAPKRRKHRDPYALAQAAQRRTANLARQEVLRKQSEATLGDPVRGITTPFVQSFDRASGSGPDTELAHRTGEAEEVRLLSSRSSESEDVPMNHFLTKEEIQTTLDYSHLLTQPVPNSDRDLADPQREEEEAVAHKSKHERATVSIQRILGLDMSNARDRRHINIQRCVTSFGRHNTDGFLPPKAPSENMDAGSDRYDGDQALKKTPRAGPDTGSSEVQIAILTMKIRALSKHLEEPRNRGPDKMNKSNLRLLVHRRQKLLNYMRRKERGGPRWEHLISTLGLTRGTYEGEISL